MRALVVLYTIFLALVCTGQTDSDTEQNKFRYGIGAQGVLGSQGGMSFSGYARVRYSVIEAGLLAGNKNRFMKNLQQYDEVYAEGYWVEPSVSLLLPSLRHKSGKIDAYESGYFRLNTALGFVKSDNEYRKIFEGLGPYQDYVYSESYNNVRSGYFRISLGIHGDLYQRVNIGYGLSYVKSWSKGNVTNDARPPFFVDPFNGKSPFAMYFEVGVLLN